MRKIKIIFLGFALTASSGYSQFTDHFNDGDFTGNPSWTGSNFADWQINAALQLQSNNTIANSTFYLSTASTKATMAEWDFFIQITFNPSSTNYIDVYLTASGSDLTLASTTGYFVRIGNSDDEISLYRKDTGGSITEIIDGLNASLNASTNTMRIRVVRDASNEWTLSRDLTAAGTGYFTEGSAIDASFTTSAFFGILVRQSTVASFAQRHFFDDIRVHDYIPDLSPPAIISLTAIDQNRLEVLFNEPVELSSGQTLSNYTVNNGIGFPASAIRDAVNTSLVHLQFATGFPNRIDLLLTVNGVKDIAGNILTNGNAVFIYFRAVQYDIIIDEIMADPLPLVNLPEAEWLELKNTSGFDINLLGWRIGKPGGQSGPMPSWLLKADSFVIITNSSNLQAMSAFGQALSVTGFPSLSNTGDLLYLRSPEGLTIHSVNYTDAWYKNELKKEGGWTLEMIDPHNPCSGITNWKAGEHPHGGTPAALNSVNAVNADQSGPVLLRAFATDSLNIVLVFNEPLDSMNASVISSYSIDNNIGSPLTASPVGPGFDKIMLKLSHPLNKGMLYTVRVNTITDCSNNTVSSMNTARVGLAEYIDSFDIIINEVLFNPFPSGTDYIEIFNRSRQILNLKNLYIANRNFTGQISGIQQLNTTDYLFFPGDFIVITEEPDLVRNNYIALNTDAFIEAGNMPPLSDHDGTIVLLNQQGNIIDELHYMDDWHFPLINNPEGVSLERIDYESKTHDPRNWHSAASSSGYGTPTYKNSQYRVNEVIQGAISVSPAVISPDNDGLDDFALIQYQFPAAGYVSGITIFDAAGRPVRVLQRNDLNGIRGSYKWDGLGEKNARLVPGIYVILTEVFSLEGKTRKFRNTIVIARKH